MQKYDKCSICEEHKLVADYGFHNEYICIDCTLNDEKLTEHVDKEMLRRHGRAKLQKLLSDALGGIVRH